MTDLVRKEVGATLSDTLDRIISRGERVVLQRRGKDVAAVVSLRDLEFLEALEDREDVEEALRVLADQNDEVIDWEQAKKELDA